MNLLILFILSFVDFITARSEASFRSAAPNLGHIRKKMRFYVVKQLALLHMNKVWPSTRYTIDKFAASHIRYHYGGGCWDCLNLVFLLHIVENLRLVKRARWSPIQLDNRSSETKRNVKLKAWNQWNQYSKYCLRIMHSVVTYFCAAINVHLFILIY
jgi:hypothetical protein